MEEDEDPTAELAFHFGGANAGETQAPYTVCFDDMHLDDPKFVKPKKAEEAPIPAVTVNQTGYLPALPKLATVKSASTTPLKWELLKKGGAVVASGETQAGGQGRRLGRGRARRRLLVGDGARQGLHAEGGQRRQPPVRHRRRRLPQAQVRRARDLLSPAQRHRDHDAVRGRQAVDAPGRPREREGQRSGQGFAQHRRQGGPLPARTRAATTRSTSPAAGTTPAITASTSSTAASRPGRC